MPITRIQSAKNQSVYQVQPLKVTLPAGSSAGNYLVVVVEAQKSGYPFNVGQINAQTPSPIVTDDKGNVYTLVDSLVTLAQNGLSSPPVLSPDASGFFPSAYVYITAAPAVTGTQSVSLAAFYPDEYTVPLQPNGNLASPPIVNGRPVFNGGLHAQVFELAGVTAVDQHAHVTATDTATLGAAAITTSATAFIIEVGLLIDSASLLAHTDSTSQYAEIIGGGSTHYVVQTTSVTGATASSGFKNPLLYTGGVVAVSLK